MSTLSRYMGEQRMYVIFVDTTSANGLFEQGLNAILVSRSTLLNSKLNTSIFNFNPSSPGEMEDFKGANFYAYDIMSLVAQQGFEMSDTGALPKTLAGAIWEGLTGLVAGVSDVLYQGLVAIGNFFASLGDAVASWGQKLVGGLSKAADAVKGAVQAVLDALNALVKWIIAQLRNAMSIIFGPIVNKIKEMVRTIYDVFLPLSQDSEDGNITEEFVIPARDIILQIYLICLLASMSLTMIAMAFGPMAVLVSLAIPIAIIALYELINGNPPIENVQLPTFSFDTTISDLFEYIEPILGVRGGRGGGSRLAGSGGGWAGIVTAILGISVLSSNFFVAIFGKFLGFKGDVIGKALAGAVLGALSLMISYLIQGLIPNTSTGIRILQVFAVFSLFFSLSSMLGSALEILFSGVANVPGITIAGFCLSGITAIAAVLRLMDP